jgi:hypothetical protein
MGNSASAPKTPGAPAWTTRRRCAAKPPYAEPRGFALTTVYGVPPGLLNRYPPHVYDSRQAAEDIAACAAGRRPPHAARVVRFDKIAGGDLRAYALKAYHGYTAADLRDPRTLQLLPYTDKDAQVDIAYFRRHRRPYYRVVKQTSQVLDPKRGTARDWRHHGYRNGYRYGLTETPAKRLGGRVKRKFDASKYPRVRGAGGRGWVHLVPCAELPAMCRPGDTVFPYAAEGESGAAEHALARARKLRARQAQAAHSRRMQALAEKLRGLDPGSAQHAKVRAKRDALRRAFRNGGKPGGGKPGGGRE